MRPGETVDQTRRDWVRVIGSAVLGAGIAWRARGASANDLDLPPGVYLPSKDHLSHALMSADGYHSIPPGCPIDYVQPATGPFTPAFFSAPEFAVIHRVTELLLGHPSAELNDEVARWIDLEASSAAGIRDAEAGMDPLYRALARAYFGPDGAKSRAANAAALREGVAWLRTQAHTRYSGDFASLPEEQQLALLHSISDEEPKRAADNSGTRFFAVLKAEAVKGYYTSRAGLKELDFKGNRYYARSPGCSSK